jgi:hypothetical protein
MLREKLQLKEICNQAEPDKNQKRSEDEGQYRIGSGDAPLFLGVTQERFDTGKSPDKDKINSDYETEDVTDFCTHLRRASSCLFRPRPDLAGERSLDFENPA